MIVFLLSGFLPCCLAASAQVSAGPTLDTSGVMAVRVNAGFSFGIALPESSAATVGLGVQAGTEAPLSITGSYAYTRFDGALGARAELLTTASLIGSTGTVELAPSVLFVRHQSRSESAASEKSFFSTSTTVSGRAISVRPHGGLQVRDNQGEAADKRTFGGVFGVDVGYEFFLIDVL